MNATKAETKRNDDAGLIIDMREVISRARAEIARLCVRNRELERELFVAKESIAQAESRRKATEIYAMLNT